MIPCAEAEEDDWEPVGNRGDVGCRTEDGGKGEEGATYKVHTEVSSIEKCKKLCKEKSGCKGVEHNAEMSGGRCELWTVPIGDSAHAEGFTCLRFHGAKKISV